MANPLEYIKWQWAEGTATALAVNRGRAHRLLLVPALFDEGNKLRRFSVEVMRRLDAAGVDCWLPDLPGCGESLAPLAAQTPSTWRAAMTAAAEQFAATHVLAIRGGALVAPALPGWALAPVKGASVLRQMLRARVLAAREAGREESSEALLAELLGLHERFTPAVSAYWLRLSARDGYQRALAAQEQAARGQGVSPRPASEPPSHMV